MGVWGKQVGLGTQPLAGMVGEAGAGPQHLCHPQIGGAPYVYGCKGGYTAGHAGGEDGGGEGGEVCVVGVGSCMGVKTRH